MRYPNAKALSRAHIDALARHIEQEGRGRLGYGLAKRLRAAAKTPFAADSAIGAQSLELKLLLSQITFTNKQLAGIDREMELLLDEAGSIITTIPGIGIACGAAILGEIGDNTRFDRPSCLVAYAGLDPSVYESGELK